MTGSKKFGLGLVAALLAAVLYYFAAGSGQLSAEMQQRVNTELSTLEQNGFALKKREKQEKEEHVEISFNEPKKMLTFFKKQGSEMTLEDAEVLRGMKIGLDIHYLKDSYSALSVDIYPITLPSVLTETADMNTSDKQLILQLNDMLKRKALLLHVDVNKLLSGFKGYAKDINESFMLKEPVNITSKGTTFEGTIKDDRVNLLTQEVKNITVSLGKALHVVVENLKSTYAINGKTIYDSHYQYHAEKIDIKMIRENIPTTVTFKNIAGENVTAVENALVSNKMTMNIAETQLQKSKNKSKLIDTAFSFNVNGLDMNILKQLESVDINDTETRDKLVQALIAKGISLEIPSLEVKKLEYQGKTIDGFSLNSSFSIKKTANLQTLTKNPFTLIDAINTRTKLELSNAFFSIIAQQPQMMMIAMLIQPKVINGKKVYEVELKDGKLSVNGSPVM